MRCIITGDLSIRRPSEGAALKPFDKTLRIMTQGWVEDCPNLDHSLRLITCWCAAERPQDRPTLVELRDYFNARLGGKSGADYYKDSPRERVESDENIKRLVQMFILDADTDPVQDS